MREERGERREKRREKREEKGERGEGRQERAAVQNYTIQGVPQESGKEQGSKEKTEPSPEGEEKHDCAALSPARFKD